MRRQRAVPGVARGAAAETAGARKVTGLKLFDKVTELLGLLGCYDVIQRLISRMSQFINIVATAH